MKMLSFWHLFHLESNLKKYTSVENFKKISPDENIPRANGANALDDIFYCLRSAYLHLRVMCGGRFDRYTHAQITDYENIYSGH